MALKGVDGGWGVSVCGYGWTVVWGLLKKLQRNRNGFKPKSGHPPLLIFH